MLRTFMVLSALVLCGCATSSPPADSQDRLTVGTVQREIRIGMSGADVAKVLGSPNIVTTDEQRREAWVYDKMSTQVNYAHREGVLFALIVGGASGSGSTSVSQKTLTIVIKFDENQKVRDFAYHSSTF